MAELIKLVYPPQKSSYSNSESKSGFSRLQLKGGSGRYRADLEGASHLVDCEWLLDADAYDYLCAFRRMFARNPAPFLVDLVIDNSEILDCEACFMPDSFSMSRLHGPAHRRKFTVRAQLEVTPPEFCPEDDDNLVCIVEAFGKCWLQCTDPLDKLVNYDLPEIMPYKETS